MDDRPRAQAQGSAQLLRPRRSSVHLAALEADTEINDSLKLITHVRDETLGAFSRDAAFCVYPSLYEGFGLPPIEALANSKALIASAGGEIPEIVSNFALCLDPRDPDDWALRISQWIEAPTEREDYVKATRAGFRHVTWDEAARCFFEVVAA